jgi:hypothetical protein
MSFTSPRDVVVGCFCVLVGVVAAVLTAHAARRTRNWLFLVIAAGAAVFVLGIVGQRPFPSEDAVRLDPAGAAHHTPGPWEAGVHVPIVELQATPVAVGGFLLAVVGVSLALFFEAVPDRDRVPSPPLPPLEEGDTV